MSDLAEALADAGPCFGCSQPNEPGYAILLLTTNGPCCLPCLKEMLALPLDRRAGRDD